MPTSARDDVGIVPYEREPPYEALPFGADFYCLFCLFVVG